MSNNKQTNFKVYALQTVSCDKMYVHWSEGLSMYIVKDGSTIRLHSEEIKQLVKALPKTIGGTY